MDFFVVDETATPNDYYQLILHTQKTVADHSGIVLEPEILFWGEF